jgi:NAD+ diphosphatase
MSLSQPLNWSPATLDRESGERVKPGFLAEALAAENLLTLVLAQGRTLLNPDGTIAYLAPDEASALRGQAGPDALDVYLGRTLTPPLPPGTRLALLAGVDGDAALAAAPAGAGWAGFRDVAALLSEQDSAVFVESLAIANWHGSHRFCPRCGAPTEIVAAGWVRRCSEDGSEHYPRTDPAIIAAVVGPDGRILLGGGNNWDANRFSTLAGFVEPGESLEQAVVREIAEEVGVRVHRAEYLGSQAWPFPASLMLGYLAHTDDTVATPDGEEVTRARWISRADMQPLVSSGEIVISGRLSIARRLIEHWYGGRILDAGEEAPGAAAETAGPQARVRR